ncbi:hypothetical protein [Pseudomonas oryzihabitans]|uniref:Uncharacterized protein n=1 Tax=Pseudomonas oryzihabitans TaxID=47885 RepID=A0A178LJF7_9PSED|nr:hypothetical protein [Pseudomonas oryzihabitans]OAN31152.1 hypothetical protein A4V15_14185 [Pseudomonas oryzihabitans]
MPSPKSAAKARSGGGPGKAPQLCKVTFGYQELVLPVDKGLALVGLLKDAVPVGYGGAGMYVPKLEELELSLEVLKPGQFALAKPTLH